uniref:Uncharacterized protein n=1 Tax=Glossina brevipalpis TaxID=37001 RepID=A0A1A9VZZ8_9MUSC
MLIDMLFCSIVLQNIYVFLFVFLQLSKQMVGITHHTTYNNISNAIVAGEIWMMMMNKSKCWLHSYCMILPLLTGPLYHVGESGGLVSFAISKPANIQRIAGRTSSRANL